MAVQALKDAILSFLYEDGSSTFLALCHLPGFTPEPEDPDSFFLPFNLGLNVILWRNVTKDAIQAIDELFAKERLINVVPSDVMVYHFDGGYLDMPIATPKRVRSGVPYQKLHWLPAEAQLTEKGREIGRSLWERELEVA